MRVDDIITCAPRPRQEPKLHWDNLCYVNLILWYFKFFKLNKINFYTNKYIFSKIFICKLTLQISLIH